MEIHTFSMNQTWGVEIHTFFYEPDMEYGVWGYGNSYIFLHGLGVLLLGQLEALELCPQIYELPLKPRLHVLRVHTTRVGAMRGWGGGG